MGRQLAGVSLAMLGCDQREIGLAEALVELGTDLRLVGFPRRVPSSGPCILMIQLRQFGVPRP